MTDIVDRLKGRAAHHREEGWELMREGNPALLDQAASEIERLRSALAAEREECAKVADRCSDGETRKALGANAAILASQIASAIRNRT